MPFIVRLEGSVANPKITFSGEEKHVIKKEDFAVIGLSEGKMKDRLDKAWGHRPNDVYFTDNLPWHDQSYGKYNLDEVWVRRKIRSATILDASTEPYAAVGHASRNKSSSEADVTIDTSLSVTNTIETNWNASVAVGVSQSISWEVGGDVYGGKVGGETTMSMEASYGQGGSKSKEESVGSSVGVSVHLKPHSAAQAKLTATKGSIVARVEYETTWGGHVWANYDKKTWIHGHHGGHHFYFDEINNHFPGHVIDTEIARIDLYVNADIEIEDIPLTAMLIA